MIEPGPVIPQFPTPPSEPVPGQGTGSDLLPVDTLDSNVRGRPITPPAAGFGKLWRKRYWIRLPAVEMSPEALVQYWRTDFGHMWPQGNAFYRPISGLQEGEVALFDLAMPFGARLSTGVVVVDVEPTAFTFQTSRGHSFAGRITFSARDTDGVLIAQVESEIRASDPLYELGLPIGGHQREDAFWKQTLRNLAAHLGVTAEPEMTMTEIDGRRKWRNAGNIRDNAFLHTAVTMVLRPLPICLWAAWRQGCVFVMDRSGAVVIGSGPNGLAAAIELARAGRDVRVFEANAEIGGGCRSAELTLPGFVHDTCSAIHPLGVASPFFQTVPLASHGLEWVDPPLGLAHPFPDGSAAVLSTALDETAASVGEDGQAWVDLFEPLIDDFPLLIEPLLSPLRIPQHPVALGRFGLVALRSARSLAESRFTGDHARGMFAGLSAHSILDLRQPATAAFGLVLGMIGHVVGWPIPRGGSQEITDALVRELESLGGEIVTDSRITTLDQAGDAGAIIFNTNPRQLRDIAGDALPEWYSRILGNFRHGPGVFKLDWALDGPVPWTASECSRAGTVHLGPTIEEIVASERAATSGRIPDRPFVILAQQSLFDPTRAPDGAHTLWGYCHVPNGSTVDMTERIEDQIERFAPGFRDRVIARSVMGPAEIEGANANFTGGDINAGAQDLRQLYTRPVPRYDPYSTPNPRLYIGSSSTPPGGGVHGMGGHYAAMSALRRAW